ncbi:MAG: aspartyl protease family protein, partial [Myxococcales bacterium]|nr:aspartyl protease family protein [Myxococcales bacterium]
MMFQRTAPLYSLALLIALTAAACSDNATSPSLSDSSADGSYFTTDAIDPDLTSSSDADVVFDQSADLALDGVTCPEGSPMGLDWKVLFDVTINGQGPFTLLFDTGAPTSVLDDDVAALVGNGPLTFEMGGEQAE